MAYPIDAKDSVVALAELPRPTAGAGEPALFGSEYLLQIAYYVDAGKDPVALVTLSGPEAHYFGPPHVDAVDRHPLHSRGLEIYGAFEVHDSSWLRELRQTAGRCIKGRHFILSFTTSHSNASRATSPHRCIANIQQRSSARAQSI